MFVTLEKLGCPNYRVNEDGLLQHYSHDNWKDVRLKKNKKSWWFETRSKKAVRRNFNLAEVLLEVFVIIANTVKKGKIYIARIVIPRLVDIAKDLLNLKYNRLMCKKVISA